MTLRSRLTGDFTDDFLRGARVKVGSFETFVANVAYDDALNKTTVTVLDSAVLPGTLTGLTIGTPNTPIFDFDSDLGNLVSFNNPNFNFASIIDALLLVRDMLVEIDGDAVQGVFNAPIPLVDVSINDLLDFADTFSDALTAGAEQPCRLAATARPDDQRSVRRRDNPAGSGPLKDLIRFSLDNFDTD